MDQRDQEDVQQKYMQGMIPSEQITKHNKFIPILLNMPRIEFEVVPSSTSSTYYVKIYAIKLKDKLSLISEKLNTYGIFKNTISLRDSPQPNN